jgi:hypothetical protein
MAQNPGLAELGYPFAQVAGQSFASTAYKEFLDWFFEICFNCSKIAGFFK